MDGTRTQRSIRERGARQEGNSPHLAWHHTRGFGPVQPCVFADRLAKTQITDSSADIVQSLLTMLGRAVPSSTPTFAVPPKPATPTGPKTHFPPMTNATGSGQGRVPRIWFFTPVASGVTTGTAAPISSDKPKPVLLDTTQISPEPSSARKIGLVSTPPL